ncbi:MAG: sigma-54-dependent Fis family transcriptional regulator [Desulfobacteraceae bacterium IS3]|nr:MAG: sigma-54-dependent Fis family transcriptional regulator [Desulfobacteraceae bacterium IS3]
MFEKELSRYWKTIIETMADGLMVVDPAGIIVSVNSAMEHLTGYSRAEIVGQSCSMLGCDVCAKERTEGVDKHCALFKKKSIRRAKCTLRKKDGSLLYAIKNASILKDSSDNVIGGVETLTDLSEVMSREKVISKLRHELDSKAGFHGMIGESAVMRRTSDLISSAAQSDAPIVIYGESGTGKELVAEAIHRLGRRRNKPFIKVNCAALNESLLESELFGHVRGAFTGAGHTRIGRFEAANQGDIFLDEIGDISASVQVKLLRVLQEKEIERVGDHKPISTDVRIISATHKDLVKLVESGRFREDLYYRIGVIPIYLPPLRERREDIALLINSFIARLRLKTEKPISGMSSEAFAILNAYGFPGNVREMINIIEYAFVLCSGGDILPEHLPRLMSADTLCPLKQARQSPYPQDVIGRQQLLDALISTQGNKAEAARMLGISRVSLYKRLGKYDIKTNKSVSGTD